MVALQIDIDLYRDVHCEPEPSAYERNISRFHLRNHGWDPKIASAASLFNLLPLAFHQDPFLTGHTRLESLMRTICAGIVEERKGPRDDIFEWLARWFRLISHNPTELARFRESLGKVDSQDWDRFWIFSPDFLSDKSLLPPLTGEQDQASAEAETWHDSADLTRFLESFLRNHKRLALTRRRRDLALTMLSVKPGDEIWILFNGRTPYVLRKIEGEEHGYYFVGEAYVHGFMEGEIFSRDKVDGLDVRIEDVVLV